MHVIASYAHDTKHRTPILLRARDTAAAIVGSEIAARLVEHNPRAILEGQPLPYSPKPALRG